MQDQDSPRGPWFADLGSSVRAARRRRDMSQEAVALESGLQRKTVYQVECGKTNLRLGTLYRVAVAVEVPVVDLLADVSLPAMALGRVEA